jgi:hypothetical protein
MNDVDKPSLVHIDARGRFIHHCQCGAEAGFGYGVDLRHGKLGTWFCAEHRPDKPTERENPRDLALENSVTEWRHHPATSPNHCAHCGKPGGVLLPTGVDPYAWIHDTCHDPWRAARRAQAIAVLASYGITKRDAARTSSPVTTSATTSQTSLRCEALWET